MFRALAVLVALVALPASAAPCAGFVDVDDSSPFCANVVWMKTRSITLGCAANLYCPNDAVSRLAISAFLNRLGDAVLPPNVLWVAPVGGTFQSIQAAINHAAGIATASTPVVIKVAPGTFQESIALAPYVQVEGASETLTTIQSTGLCNSPGAGTVVLAPNSQIRRVTIRTGGCTTGIYIDGGGASLVSFADAVIRDVRIFMNVVGPSAAGIRVTGNVSDVGPIQRVTMNLQQGLPNYGVLADSPGVVLALSDVNMLVAGATGSTGFRFEGGNAQLERVVVNAVGPGGPNIFGIDATNSSVVHVRESTLMGFWTSVRTSAAAQVRLTNTAIANPVSGTGVVCLNTYDPQTLAPVSC